MPTGIYKRTKKWNWSESSKKKASISKQGHIPWNKGKKDVYSKETIELMRSAQLGKPGPNIGRKASKETILKLRASHLGQVHSDESRKKMRENNNAKKGELNPRWIKDRTKLKISEDRRNSRNNDWVRQVKKRDDFKCKIYNKECNGQLEVHHILSWRDYPELRYDINNGITLCHFHHPRKYEEEKNLSPYFQELINTNN